MGQELVSLEFIHSSYWTFNFKVLVKTFYIMKMHPDIYLNVLMICLKLPVNIMLLLEFLCVIPENPFKKLSSCINVLYYSFIFVCILYIL